MQCLNTDDTMIRLPNSLSQYILPNEGKSLTQDVHLLIMQIITEIPVETLLRGLSNPQS